MATLIHLGRMEDFPWQPKFSRAELKISYEYLNLASKSKDFLWQP